MGIDILVLIISSSLVLIWNSGFCCFSSFPLKKNLKFRKSRHLASLHPALNQTTNGLIGRLGSNLVASHHHYSPPTQSTRPACPSFFHSAVMTQAEANVIALNCVFSKLNLAGKYLNRSQGWTQSRWWWLLSPWLCIRERTAKFSKMD